MKIIRKRIKKSIFNSIPFSFNRELTGYIKNGFLYYCKGTKINCPTFPDKKIVFHTHIDVIPNRQIITLPDLPSPVDILVFLMNDAKKMFIKTPRVFITFKKTQKSNDMALKIVRCVFEHKDYWKRMNREQQHERMFFYALHYIKKNIKKKNKTWNLSWKRIIEQVFKIKVKIETSNVKDPI